MSGMCRRDWSAACWTWLIWLTPVRSSTEPIWPFFASEMRSPGVPFGPLGPAIVSCPNFSATVICASSALTFASICAGVRWDAPAGRPDAPTGRPDAPAWGPDAARLPPAAPAWCPGAACPAPDALACDPRAARAAGWRAPDAALEAPDMTPTSTATATMKRTTPAQTANLRLGLLHTAVATRSVIALPPPRFGVRAPTQRAATTFWPVPRTVVPARRARLTHRHGPRIGADSERILPSYAGCDAPSPDEPAGATGFVAIAAPDAGFATNPVRRGEGRRARVDLGRRISRDPARFNPRDASTRGAPRPGARAHRAPPVASVGGRVSRRARQPPGASAGGREQLREVQRATPARVELRDLGAAAEAVGEDRGRRVSGPDRGEHHPLGTGAAHLQVSGLEAEVAGQSAAAAVQALGLDPAAREQLGVGIPAEHRVLVAVHLDERPRGACRGGRQRPTRRVLDEQLGERHCLRGHPLDEIVAGPELCGVGAQHGRAARLETNDQPALAHVLPQPLDAPPQHAPRDSELAGRDPREPAAERLRRDLDGPAGLLEQPHGGAADARGERVRERVRPQQHGPPGARGAGAPLGSRVPGAGGGAAGRVSRRAPVTPRAAPRGPLLQALVGQPGERALLQARGRARQPPQARTRADRVHHRDRVQPRRSLGKQRQPAERVVTARSHAPLPVLEEELCLVGRHVDADRAVALAALAGQAEVERVADRVRAPSVADRPVGVPVEHLEQQPGSPAGRVLLLERHLVGGAHDGALARVLPTLADADAAPGRMRERAAVLRERERRRAEIAGLESRHPQVRVERERADELARVHPVVGVEDRLQATERLHDPVAVHAGEQLAALAVAVLAGDRAAVGDDEVGRLLEEAPEVRPTGSVAQVERDPAVHAAVPEVAVERGQVLVGVAVATVELLEVAQVVAESHGRHRRVVPALVRLRLAGQVRGRAQDALAHAPQGVLARRVVEERDAVGIEADRVEHPPRSAIGLLERVAAELDEQPGATIGQLSQRVEVLVLEPLVGHEPLIEPLEGDRLVLRHLGDGVAGLADRRKAEHDERPAANERDEA